MKKITTRQLVESALMVAVATVLSMIKPFDLTGLDFYGGGVTLVSMLPLIMVSHRYGWKWGAFTAFVYSVLQILLGMSNFTWLLSVYTELNLKGWEIALRIALMALFDYVLAYTVIGFSGAFGKGYKAVAIGIAVTMSLRLLCHLVSGAVIWAPITDKLKVFNFVFTNPWLYSLVYNGKYMIPEIIITEIVAKLLYKPMKRFFEPDAVKK